MLARATLTPDPGDVIRHSWAFFQLSVLPVDLFFFVTHVHGARYGDTVLECQNCLSRVRLRGECHDALIRRMDDVITKYAHAEGGPSYL